MRVRLDEASGGETFHYYGADRTSTLSRSPCERRMPQCVVILSICLAALSAVFFCAPLHPHSRSWLRSVERSFQLGTFGGLVQPQSRHFAPALHSKLKNNLKRETPAAEETDEQIWTATNTALPQRFYWKKQWPLPGTKWVLSGHSRAMERTGFHLRGGPCNIMLDAGIDLPSPHCTPPRMVLLTHAHADHANALPMILQKRHTDPVLSKSTHIFLPLGIMRRLREFCLMSRAIQGDERVIPYPSIRQRLHEPDIMPGAALCSSALEGSNRLWRPVVPGMRLSVPVGAANSRQVMDVAVLKCDHTVPACGYVLLEQRRRLKPEYARETKQLTEANVVAAKKRGETVDAIVHLPLLAYLLDTTTEVLEHSQEQSDLIFSCPFIIIECSYLELDMEEEARVRRHTIWPDLVPFVRHSITEAVAKGTNPPTWILVHFSLRYTELEIVTFFEQMGGLGRRLPPQPRPPNLLLWLDNRLVELWYED
eukprot:GGOE01014476.1.p1 GENE.GGOE01014476.1~~GGOE01014476.1.p1  ORF type:complete len:481 (+),score=66.29 GGOE01014476.1:48-1490(+)